MKLFHGLVAVTMVAGVAGAFWVGRHSQRSVPPHGESSEGAEPVRGQSETGDDIARLERALGKTQDRLARMEAKQLQSPPAASDPGDTVPKAVTLTPDQIGEQFLARGKAFVSEPRDNGWATQEEQMLSKATQTAMANGQKYTVEYMGCRTTMCRMEVSLSGEDEHRFGVAFSGQISNSDIAGSHFFPLRRNEDGTEVLQILAFRRGYPMPGDQEPE